MIKGYFQKRIVSAETIHGNTVLYIIIIFFVAVIYLKAGIFEGGRISDVSNFALKLGYYFVDMKKTEIEST